MLATLVMWRFCSITLFFIMMDIQLDQIKTQPETCLSSIFRLVLPYLYYHVSVFSSYLSYPSQLYLTSRDNNLKEVAVYWNRN